jgi:outer membrane protein TolC
MLNPEQVLVKAVRGLVRRLRQVITRMFLVHLHAELAEMKARQDRLERQLHSLLGRSHDHGAIARRLAALEDRWLDTEPVQDELPWKLAKSSSSVVERREKSE